MIIISRKDFGGNKRYIRGFSKIYNVEAADRFKNRDIAEQALEKHIRHTVDMNISDKTMNEIKSHYEFEEVPDLEDALINELSKKM